MNCQNAEHCLYTGRNELAEAQRAELAAHLSTCPACRQIATNLDSCLLAMQTETRHVPVPNPDFEWAKVRRQLHRQNSPAHPLARWLALPAAVAAAAAIGLYVSREPSQLPAQRTAAPVIARSDAPAAAEPSTVVFVDDRSGWTFVVASDLGAGGTRI